MKTTKVKSITFMNGMSIDIYNGIADIFIILEDDGSEYWLKFATLQALASGMDERKQKFFEPFYPFIIV